MNEKETIKALMAPYRYNELGSAVCAPETKMRDAIAEVSVLAVDAEADNSEGGNK